MDGSLRVSFRLGLITYRFLALIIIEEFRQGSMVGLVLGSGINMLQ